MDSLKTLADITDWEKFLEDNFHQLSRRIRVENLLDRLRSQTVISQEDQENVLHKYCTQFLKAGLLVDTIRTKGRLGFEKFMEAVEYEYPDLYSEITGIAARRQDSSCTANGRRQASMLVLDKMGDLIGAFTQQVRGKNLQIQEKEEKIQEKEVKLEELKDLVTQLKSDLDRQSDEQKVTEDRMKELNGTVKELRSENKDLSDNLTKEKLSRQDLDDECKALREEKLKVLYEESHQPIQKSIALNPFIPGTLGLNPQGTSKPKKTPPLSPAVNGPGQINTTNDLENNLAQFQESNNLLEICLDEFKKESERCKSQRAEEETVTRAIILENEDLKIELRKLEEQCKHLVDVIGDLMKEINMKTSKMDPGKTVLPNIQLFPLFKAPEDKANGSVLSTPNKKKGWKGGPKTQSASDAIALKLF